MEEHLTDELTLESIDQKVNLSPFYFQKGFSIRCGVTVSEYIRNRRLSLAGRDLQIDRCKVIADDYIPSKDMSEEFETIVIPENTWAVFPCKGQMPESLQKVNTEIFSEWLPGNSDYEIAGMYNIEYFTAPDGYPNGNQDENYYCEIWMPVKSKKWSR